MSLAPRAPSSLLTPEMEQQKLSYSYVNEGRGAVIGGVAISASWKDTMRRLSVSELA
jgi:hypothetical protein